MKDETRRWVERAEDHLAAAMSLLEMGHPSQGIYFCQLALEVLLKAIWVEDRSESPQRTHNLLYLVSVLEIELADGQREILRKLSWEIIPTRYPEGPDPDSAAAGWYYQETKEVFAWLRQKLT